MEELMSAPKTNVEKQKRRHWPARIGIVMAAVLAIFALVVLVGWGGLPSDEQAAPDAIEQNG
jgi:hypothetical protein